MGLQIIHNVVIITLPRRQSDDCSASHTSNMQRSIAPIKPPTEITAADAAPLAPMFAKGSAYVPLVALLPLLLLLRQVSVAPLLVVTLVVTLPI